MAKSHAHAQQFRQALRLFTLFGHPLRVVIFQRLVRRPARAGVLAQQLPVSRVAVVQHVKQLERAGLVAGVRQGRCRIYHARPERLAPLRNWLARHSGP
jgi:predicted transcriptional regulator